MTAPSVLQIAAAALFDACIEFRKAQKHLMELRTVDERTNEKERSGRALTFGQIAAVNRVSPDSGDHAVAEHHYQLTRRALERCAAMYADARASAAISDGEPAAHGTRRGT